MLAPSVLSVSGTASNDFFLIEEQKIIVKVLKPQAESESWMKRVSFLNNFKKVLVLGSDGVVVEKLAILKTTDLLGTLLKGEFSVTWMITQYKCY